MARGIDTKCIHLEEDEGQCSHYGALSYPIYQTATYAHPGVGQSTGFDYSRLQNPTREHLEKMVAALENGIDAFALSSGMAAISLLMELFRPGDHIRIRLWRFAISAIFRMSVTFIIGFVGVSM